MGKFAICSNVLTGFESSFLLSVLINRRQFSYINHVTMIISNMITRLKLHPPNFKKMLHNFVLLLKQEEQIPHFAVFFTCVLCSIPLMLGWEFRYTVPVESAPVFRAAKSPIFQNFLIGGITVIIPVVIDFLLDNVFSSKKNKDEQVPQKGFVGLLIPFLFLVVWVCPEGQVSFLPFVFHAQRIFYFQTFSYHMYVCGAPIWTKKRMIWIVLIATAGEVIDCYSPFTAKHINFVLDIISLVLHVIATLIFIRLVYLWYKHIHSSTRNGNKRLTHFEYCCNLYVFALLTAIVGVALLTAGFGLNYWEDISIYYLCGNVLLVAALAVIVILSHMRENRRTMTMTQVCGKDMMQGCTVRTWVHSILLCSVYTFAHGLILCNH